MFTQSVQSSLEIAVPGRPTFNRMWCVQGDNPNVDRSAPPPSAKKKTAKKKTTRKKGQ